MWIAFFGLILAAPLLHNHYYPWPSFLHEYLASLSLLALGFLAIKRLDNVAIRLPTFVLLILIFTLVPWAQLIFKELYFFGDAVLASLYITGFAFAITLGFLLAKDHPVADLLSLALVAGALVSFFLSLNQWLGLGGLGIWLSEIPPNARPSANLGQPNNLASLFMLGLVSAVYLRERKHISGALLLLVSILLFAGLAITRSRMPMVAMLVGSVWAFVGVSRFNLNLSKIQILAGTFCFFAIWLIWPTLSDALYLSAESSVSRLAGVGGDARLIMWQQLLDAAFRQPWFGYGLNQVSVAQMAVAAEYPASVVTEHAHNIFLDLLIWLGIPLGGLTIGLILWWLSSRCARLHGLTAWFGMMIVLILGTHAMFEFPLDYAYFLVPFGLAVGFVESGYPSAGRGISVDKRWLMLFSIVGSCLMGWVFVEYQKVEADYRLLRFESARIAQRSPDHMAPDVVLLTQVREFIRFARTEAKEGMSDAELEWMRQVAFRFPYPPVMFRYALALGLNDQFEAASLQILRLRQLHPPKRYEEAVDGWHSLSVRYPKLANVALPEQVSGK